MNILEIVSGTDVNGAVVHCLLLTRALLKRGHRVTLLCRPNAWIARQLAEAKIPIIESDMHRFPFDELRRIAALAREQRIDLLHTHMTHAHNFGVFLRRFGKIPCIATAHSHIVHFHWRLADHVIAVSEATRRYHRRHNFVSSKRITTVHNFVDCESFLANRPDARLRMRETFGVDESEILIGVIGDVIPRKGQIHLVRALPQILASVPEVRLAIIGKPPKRPDYQERVQAETLKLGVAHKILWTGHLENIPEVLAALDLYVLSSLHEVFPLAVLEAMAAGLPLVATAVGGVPECVIHEETGLLVRPGNSRALAETVLRLLREPKQGAEMGVRARALVQREFSIESQVPRIEAVVEQVLTR